MMYVDVSTCTIAFSIYIFLICK